MVAYCQETESGRLRQTTSFWEDVKKGKGCTTSQGKDSRSRTVSYSEIVAHKKSSTRKIAKRIS